MSPVPTSRTVRVERRPFASELLAGNRQGDPPLRDVVVVLPPGYDDSALRYPVVWLLAGYASFGESMLARACFDEAIDQRVARLFDAGLPHAIVVLPDAATRLGGSQYVDSSALGPYASHLVRELVPWVDATFRTWPEAEGRAVAGKSSGGFGALHLALEFPGTFGAVASHSGDLGFELCYGPDFPVCAGALARAGGIGPFLDAFFAAPRKSTEQFTTIATLAMAAAYSPNPAAAHGFDLPFDLETCTLDAACFARWLAFDPIRRVAAGAAALRSLRALFVDCGTRDEHQLHFGARRFVRECRAHGIAVEHEEFDAGHRGTSFRWDRSLPRLLAALRPAGR